MTPTTAPCTTDVDTGGFWQAARRHAIGVLLCSACRHVLHMPKQYCADCGSFDTEWTDAAPRGRLYSWTVVRRQILPDHAVPYTVVLVELDDFPEVRLVGQLPGEPELVAGQQMVATFRDFDEFSLPVWQLVVNESS